MKNIYFTFLLLITSLFVFCGINAEAYAMSCSRPDDPMSHYDVIFKGEAISSVIRPEYDEEAMLQAFFKGEPAPEEYGDQALDVALLWMGKPVKTTFQVLESYKGTEDQLVEIYHQSPSVVGTGYEVGKRYIIFAKVQNGHIITGNCSEEISEPDSVMNFDPKSYFNKDTKPK